MLNPHGIFQFHENYQVFCGMIDTQKFVSLIPTGIIAEVFHRWSCF